jgi:predicted TIM-barrel fold metal-dependent hydrolase
VIFDADMHVVEPADLWTNRLPDELDPWRPHGIGSVGVLVGGHSLPNVPGGPPVATEDFDFGPGRVYGFAARANWSAASTLEAMDKEGIDRAVLYPTRGLFACTPDAMPEPAVSAVASTYNRWLANYVAPSGGRLLGAALVPLQSPDVAVQLVQEAYALGLVAACVRPNPVAGRTLDARLNWPVFAAMERLGIPLALHEGGGTAQEHFGERYRNVFKIHAAAHAFELMGACMDMTVGGVLDAFPGLRVAFLEAGAGWVPYWLDRLDDHYRGLYGPRDCPNLDHPPSYYFQRQCFVSAEPDEDIVRVMQRFPMCVLFGSDYPHADGKFPHAVRNQRRGLGPAQASMIFQENPCRFYGKASL